MPTAISHSLGRVGAARSDLQFVTFLLGEHEFAVNVADVVGIYRGLPLTPLVETNGCMMGNVRVGEQRVPAVSLRRFAGLAERMTDQEAQWTLVLRASGQTVAFLVDSVTEVVRLSEQSLGCLFGAGTPISDYLAATAMLHGRKIFIPDVQRLLQNALS